jgi:HSP20 family protein
MSRRDVEDWFWQLGEFQRMGEEMMPARPKVVFTRAWEPKVDVFEEEQRILVKVEIAGVKADHIQLLFVPERHALLLRGVRDEPDFADGKRTAIHQLEIFYGPFEREIALPDVPVDASNIRAQYRNGFLMILVPKVDKTIVVARTITIREL